MFIWAAVLRMDYKESREGDSTIIKVADESGLDQVGSAEDNENLRMFKLEPV